MGERKINGIKNIILVASGKGGVGKSAVAVELAVLLAERGYRVGLLDADIYGPSTPIMLGVKPDERPEIINNVFIPLERHGIKFMSVGLLVSREDALVWRAPMLTKMLNQLLVGASWGELDLLLVDTPPGTGDIHLSLAQYEIKGAVLVSTGYKVALADAHKSLAMFGKLGINILGMVGNMIKDRGVEKYARENKLELLGEIGLWDELALALDEGRPLSGGELEGHVAIKEELNRVVKNLLQHLAFSGER